MDVIEIKRNIDRIKNSEDRQSCQNHLPLVIAGMCFASAIAMQVAKNRVRRKKNAEHDLFLENKWKSYMKVNGTKHIGKIVIDSMVYEEDPKNPEVTGVLTYEDERGNEVNVYVDTDDLPEDAEIGDEFSCVLYDLNDEQYSKVRDQDVLEMISKKGFVYISMIAPA